jgi:predicted phosphodiesterase
MKIWAISDSHCFENDYKVPSDIDVVIFCGDESNNRLSYINEHEFNNWFYWFANLNIKHKLYIPGNHSTYVYEHENYIKSLFLRK